MAGNIEVREVDPKSGLVEVVATNTSSSWWANTGIFATCLAIEWSNIQGYLVHTSILIPLSDAVAPNRATSISLRVDPAGTSCDGYIMFSLWQCGVGPFSGAGRSNLVLSPARKIRSAISASELRRTGSVMIGTVLPTIHWVSPLPPAATDIGHYTLRILHDLTKLANVVLWTDASKWDPNLNPSVRLGELTQIVLQRQILG